MNNTTMRLADMVKPERNVRIHTEQQLREFERSVKMFGQIRPIVVDENNVILAGNGLYEVLIRLGYEEAMVYQFTDLTENQKKKLMIADNKIFSLGIENLDTLNAFLEDLEGDLDIPGFDSEILKQMVSEAEDVTEKLSEYGTLDDDEIKAIKEKNEKQEAAGAIQPAVATNTSGPTAPTAPTTIPQSDRIQEEQDEETAEVKKYVIAGIYVLFRRQGQLMYGTADLQPCAAGEDKSRSDGGAVHRRGGNFPLY
jgi:ParB-like chromosome segregation protein Spo0J